MNPQVRGKARRILSALALILAGFVLAATLSYFLGLPLGKIYIPIHNAHSNGKISMGDARFTGAWMLSLASFVGGLLAVIFARKRRVARNLALGALIFGAMLNVLIWLFFRALSGLD